MRQFPKVFRRFGPQIWYFLVSPYFFMLFVFLYKPGYIIDFLDSCRGGFEVNITLMTLTYFVSMVFLRLLFYSLRNIMHINWWWYFIWCMGEMMLCAVFMSVLLTLKFDGGYTFFKVFGKVIGWVYLIMIYPYAIIGLGLTLYSRNRFDDFVTDSMVRFHDSGKKLKLVLASSSLVYIKAEENYVRIYYIESDVLKEYLLRISMKGIEPTAVKGGYVRCHRSYYVNPVHIDVLRKDRDGSIFAQLKSAPGVEIPVSKRYYDDVSSKLV